MQCSISIQCDSADNIYTNLYINWCVGLLAWRLFLRKRGCPLQAVSVFAAIVCITEQTNAFEIQAAEVHIAHSHIQNEAIRKIIIYSNWLKNM